MLLLSQASPSPEEDETQDKFVDTESISARASTSLPPSGANTGQSAGHEPPHPLTPSPAPAVAGGLGMTLGAVPTGPSASHAAARLPTPALDLTSVARRVPEKQPSAAGPGSDETPRALKLHGRGTDSTTLKLDDRVYVVLCGGVLLQAVQEGALGTGDQARRGKNSARVGDASNLTRGDERGSCECFESGVGRLCWYPAAAYASQPKRVSATWHAVCV